MKKSFCEKSKIIVEPVGVCDIYEVGNWTNCYSFIKLGYKIDDYKSKYSDISFYIKNEGVIFGYFMAYTIVNINEEDIIPIYSKKLVLYDFAISARAYAKYGLILINFLINYAKNNGYKAIEIKKISKYNFFLDFLKRHFKLEKFNDAFYILIDEPKIKLSQKHLLIYDNDNVKIEDIYFLYDLKFSVRKTIIKLKLNDEESILVDRISGKIKFPTNVKVINDEVILNSYTRNIIYLLCEMYRTNQVKNLRVAYSITNPNIFEVYVDDLLYVNKDISILVSDIEYVLNMINKGIRFIYPYIVSYNMNDRTFSYGLGGIKCDDLIEKYTSSCDSKANNLLEKIKEKKLAKEFNLKLKSIKRFDFRFGNPFCGIKKLSIVFNDDIEILSNGQKENYIKPNRDEIIKELEHFYFTNWKNKYDDNINPKFENSWSIKLVFENETFEFIGFDDYPHVWLYVEWFINKYSKFYLIKE